MNLFRFSIQTPKARAAALATADQDIDVARHLLLSMFTRRNMLVPISVLPTEILTRIFHFNTFSEDRYSLGWVQVTHVCRRWRQIALDDSTLWTTFSPYPRNKEWIAERLSRARNAPLVINLCGSMGQDSFSLFTPHISHTRELYLRNMPNIPHSTVIQGINAQTAPALEHLELSMSGYLSPTKHCVGDSFFGGPLPELRIFSVSQLLFPWSLVPRARLTELNVTLKEELHISGPEVSPQDDLNALIDLLVNCPTLEVLTLKNCLPVTLIESSGGQTLRLPRLSSLCLGGSSSRVTNMLKMLKLSSSTTLHLNCAPEYAVTPNGHVILPVLSAHFNLSTPIWFRSFKINLDHVEHVLDIVASTSLLTSPIPHANAIQTDTDINPELSLSLSFSRDHDFNNVVDIILRRVCEVLPFSKLEFLSIYSLLTTPPINWGEVFRHCTEVTTVQVAGYGMASLLEALTPPRRSSGKGRHDDNGRDTRGQAPDNDDNNDSVSALVHAPIFPKLTSLLLEMLIFNDVFPSSGILFDLVLSTVEQRKAKKTPLTTLCIDQCTISEDEADALEKVVPNFRWDGDQGDVDDDNDDDDDYDYGGFYYR